MRKSIVLAAALLAAGVGQANAATKSPPPNIIPITATVDGATNLGGDTWYQVGANQAAPTTGIPLGGSTFVSQTDNGTGGKPTISYIMPTYTGNDNLLLFADGPNGTNNLVGTLTFATPVVATNFSILGASGNGGNGPAKPVVTANYADGTSAVLGTVSIPDWFGNTPVAVTANGRVSNSTNGPTGVDKFDNVNSNNPRLYDIFQTGSGATAGLLTNPNPLSPITSLTIDASGAGALTKSSTATVSNEHPSIFAVSSSVDGLTYTPDPLNPSSFNVSDVVVTPEPASLGLLGIAGLGLIARRRRA